eukprot:9037877-Heterocapsa_arctica.AAC.1
MEAVACLVHLQAVPPLPARELHMQLFLESVRLAENPSAGTQAAMAQLSLCSRDFASSASTLLADRSQLHRQLAGHLGAVSTVLQVAKNNDCFLLPVLVPAAGWEAVWQ